MHNPLHKAFKIQTIKCRECETVLAGDIVGNNRPDILYSLCNACLNSLVLLIDALELNHLPGKWEKSQAFYDPRRNSLDFANRANRWHYNIWRICKGFDAETKTE